MNSWLGGGLSSLKGQLSHLITEGTEEISDPNLEIDNARRRISELESQLQSEANEIGELKERNSNLQMKLQSEELLVQNVSESYQDKLKEKEEIIEALTNKLSSLSRASDNERDDMTTNNRISTSDDGFSNDFFGHFHGSHNQSADEIAKLQHTIRELHQEIAKWKLLSSERSQDDYSGADHSVASFEATINKLLEDQERELEMRHSNYILELQHEHSNQISFLHSKIHSTNHDDNLCDTRYSETTDAVAEFPEEKSLGNATTQTEGETDYWDMQDRDEVLRRCVPMLTKDQLHDLLDAISNKLISNQTTIEMVMASIMACGEESGLDQSCDRGIRMATDACNSDGQSSTTKIATQVKIAIADSVSQVSDISEVSMKSRILDEQVRHLTNQFSEYEKQLANIEAAPEAKDSRDDINCKIENLKVKLSQRKHISGQPHLPECADEEPHFNIVDSWENSSVNSLVEETVDTQPISRLDVKVDKAIRHLYEMLLPDESVGDGDVNIDDMLQSLLATVARLVDAAGNGQSRLESQLMGLYQELNCGSGDNDQQQQAVDVFSVLDWLADSFRTMRETCSVHDYIIEENKSLRDLVDQLRLTMANLDGEKHELIAKNSELDEQLMDMSITIARYEGLEKICDKYQKHMAAAGKVSDKRDLSMDSDDILEHVETFNQEKDECIQALESKIVSLQNLCEEKDDHIADLDQRRIDIIYEYDSLMNVLHGELDSLRASVENLQESEIGYKKQMHELHEQVAEKESMIKSLNEELTMLSAIDMEHNMQDSVDAIVENHVAGGTVDRVDDSSQTADEDGDYGQTDEEGQDHGAQLVALVAEQQRLEQVIEAQAASLGQYEIKVGGLQSDLSKLSSSLASTDRDPLSADDDMTKEALRHLSQMVRDKEWEIEALQAKNESLCAIIKKCNVGGTGADSDYLDVLLGEKQSLLKELSWYQDNREQLISSLNLKHKESLNYHGELQRLIAYMNAEQAKWSDLVAENDQLKEQLNDRLTEQLKAATDDSHKSLAPQLVDVGVSFGTDHDAPPTIGEDPQADENKQLRQRCQELELENRQSCAEIRALQKQIEQISFELEQAFLQTAETANNLTRTQHQLEYCQTELANQYKCVAPAQSSVDATKDIWSADYHSDEAVTVAGAATMTDSAAAGEAGTRSAALDNKEHWQQQLLQRQVECDNYANQIDQLKAREVKLLKEKQIFQDHLIRVEESYTQDATLAEDREQALRQQLRDAEDSLVAANAEIAQLQAGIATIRAELRHELATTRLERDDALERLRDSEAQLADHVRSVANLQSVLDHFQQDEASEALYQREKLQHDLQLVGADRDRWERQCRQLQADIDGQSELVEAARRLSQQMEHKDDQLAEIQAALARKEEMIDALRMEIRKLNTVTESKVDKVLMRNMVIGYFHTPLHRRQEALKVIGSLLQFADTDYNQIGIDTANKSRWFSWLRPSAGDRSATGQSEGDMSGKSFSELFISFLERESSPPGPQMKLPTNQIAADARHHSSLSQSAEYPYTPSTAMAQSGITDHHKFFASSPAMITKRIGSAASSANASADQQSSSGETRDTPLLYIPNIKDINSEISQKDHKAISNHRRSESGRNALLSLLDQ